MIKNNKITVINIIPQNTDIEECPICYESKNDFKIFPCFHKFCLTCVQRLEQEQVNGKIKCPLCRMEYEVTLGSNYDQSTNSQINTQQVNILKKANVNLSIFKF